MTFSLKYDAEIAHNFRWAREAIVAKGGQPVPVVMCPGCKKAMRLRLLEPASGNLETATFYCEQCGTETKREFVRDKKR